MANRGNYVPRAPRRRIEKVWSRFQESMTTTIAETDLHTCEDTKTLVRMLLDLQIVNSGDVDSNYDINISVAPKATTIAGCSTSESLDNDSSKHTLWRFRGRFKAESDEPVTLHVDSKAMRKLQTGDKLILQTKSDGAGGPILVGYSTFWFKE